MTATPPPGQPATPAEAVRWAARRLMARPEASEMHAAVAWLTVWADELDAAPVAPRDEWEQTADQIGSAFERSERDDFLGWVAYDRGKARANLKMANQALARATDPDPAAPTTYALQAQPDGPLWDNIGRCWDRSPEGQWESGALHLDWYELLDFVQWLSTVPPAGAEADRDG